MISFPEKADDEVLAYYIDATRQAMEGKARLEKLEHLWRVFVESAWHYLGCSPHSKDLAKGQVPDPAARRHAAKGVRRLVGRRAAMLERGVHKNKANVATARELACWCWAIGRTVENG